MPIYEFLCPSCGNVSEKLVLNADESVSCSHCGNAELRRLLSTSSSASGARSSGKVPGAGDTACCGSSPTSQGCIPGSCCGKSNF